MKRLVYAPKVNAYVKSDYGIIDISDYITRGGVNRKIDQVSTAELTIRNPNMKWTDHSYRDEVTGEEMIGPIFHPMDPIVIFLTRLQNRPVQVFTGFLDKSSYMQMHPGTVSLTASCTLKKLLYTYFDAGLPFFKEFLVNEGWEVVDDVGVVNPVLAKNAKTQGTITDTGFGKLLYTVMNEIGGWPDNTLYVENIPSDLIELVSRLFEEGTEESKKANDYMIGILHQIIGTASLGSGGLAPPTGGDSSSFGGPLPDHLQQYNRSYPEHLWPGALDGRAQLPRKAIEEIAAWAGLPPVLFYEITLGESMQYPGIYGIDPGGTEGLGMWMITTSYNDALIAKLGGRSVMFNPIINAKAAKVIYDSQGSGAWYGTSHVTAAGWAEDKK